MPRSAPAPTVRTRGTIVGEIANIEPNITVTVAPAAVCFVVATKKRRRADTPSPLP